MQIDVRSRLAQKLGSLGGFVIEIVGQCGVSVAPVVGHIKDGYDLFTGWAKAAAALHEQYSVSDCSYAIDTGSPAAAFQGVKTLPDQPNEERNRKREPSDNLVRAENRPRIRRRRRDQRPRRRGRERCSEPVVQLYYLATEYKAYEAVRQALDAGNLDVRLFRTYPLMGAYLMVSATFSDLIPIENFGTPGWMDYVENLKKRSFDGIYDAATGLIKDSPWEIKGLPKRPQKGAGIQFGMLKGAAEVGGNVQDVFS